MAGAKRVYNKTSPGDTFKKNKSEFLKTEENRLKAKLGAQIERYNKLLSGINSALEKDSANPKAKSASDFLSLAPELIKSAEANTSENSIANLKNLLDQAGQKWKSA